MLGQVGSASAGGPEQGSQGRVWKIFRTQKKRMLAYVSDGHTP